MKEKTFVEELLHDARKTNKRLFVIIIVLMCFWFATIGYLVYVLNDIGVIETTQEITDVESIENSNITNGDIYGEN